MDLWIVAATAGAGYVVKANCLKNSTSRTIESSSTTCSCEIHSILQPRNLLQRIRDRACPLCRLAALKGEATPFSCHSNGEAELLNYGINKRKASAIEEGLVMGSYQKLTNGKQINTKSNNGYVLKPLNFLEYCWTDEFIREQSRSEEDYLYASIESPSKYMVRPLTKGSSNNDMLIFLLGMSIGIMSTIADNRREIDSLNDLLKQSENLVQDLHDELETKDRLYVREITDEDPKFDRESFLYGTPTAFSTKYESSKFVKFDGEKLDDEKAKNDEAMCKIEAELEAELERLELNMTSSSLGRTFDSFQLDSDMEKDVTQEDDKVDKINEQPGIFYDSEHDSRETSSDHAQTEISAISPKELSLRLHEVIESRLRARITELHAALENSQKRLQAIALESQSKNPQRGLLDEVSFEEIIISMETDDDEVTLPDI
ncbi:hypothetical protein JCGZ_15716 [Jatropha curcas]|uniref:Uncharacterized protein n=1 Tax=Jatropha curcas TaxID=180498 RepID=A0A067LB38_JATCU|nr:uncharacterized protein LOC105630961 [Jatropha curcas]KDP41309.1 hypothetical protein JCGZ_15716 [Jatropha curcas]